MHRGEYLENVESTPSPEELNVGGSLNLGLMSDTSLPLGVAAEVSERTDEGAVLESERHGHEDEIEEEHGDTERLVHLPAETGDGQHHEAQHPEQDQHGTRHARTVDLHRTVEHHRVQKPRQRQPVQITSIIS